MTSSSAHTGTHNTPLMTSTTTEQGAKNQRKKHITGVRAYVVSGVQSEHCYQFLEHWESHRDMWQIAEEFLGQTPRVIEQLGQLTAPLIIL